MFHEELAVVAGAEATTLDQFVARGHANIFVFRNGCSYRDRLEQLLTRRRIAIARTMEYGSLDAILACVSAGMGITLLPVDLLDTYRHSYRFSVIRLPTEEAMAETLFIHRARAYTSPTLNAFLELLDVAPGTGRMAKPALAAVGD
jgi:DNA-binding transcriptional LysR family regulator